VKEARAEDSPCRRGRADYEKRADREAKAELSSIVVVQARRHPHAHVRRRLGAPPPHGWSWFSGGALRLGASSGKSTLADLIGARARKATTTKVSVSAREAYTVQSKKGDEFLGKNGS
jgi:hypothetical protein